MDLTTTSKPWDNITFIYQLVTLTPYLLGCKDGRGRAAALMKFNSTVNLPMLNEGVNTIYDIHKPNHLSWHAIHFFSFLCRFREWDIDIHQPIKETMISGKVSGFSLTFRKARNKKTLSFSWFLCKYLHENRLFVATL